MNNRGLLEVVLVGVSLLTGCSGIDVSAPRPNQESTTPIELAQAGGTEALAGGAAGGRTSAPVTGAAGGSAPIGSDTDTGTGAVSSIPRNLSALELACFRYVDAIQQEVMYLVDPKTGQSLDFGPLGDLVSPTILPTADPVTHLIYVVGTNQADRRALYMASGITGQLLSTLPVSDYLNGLIPDPDGRLLYGSWNGTTEDLVRLDPVSGATQKIGTIGDLETWAGLTAVDRNSGLIYSQGTDASNQSKIYVNDTHTGALVQTLPAMRGASLQVDASGALIHLDWNGTQEEVLSFNQLTNTDSVLGTVGDLMWWGGLNALDVQNHRLYVFGTPAMDSPTDSLYTVDTSNGELVQTATLGDHAAACVGF